MSHKVGEDGSITYSKDPSDNERRKAREEAAKKVGRELGSEDVVDLDEAEAHKSHPRTTAAKKTSVPRETGTRVSKETPLPRKPK